MVDWAKHFEKVSNPNYGVTFGAGATVTTGQVQAKLNALGASPPLVVDGSFGPKSVAAVSAFQRKRGLTVDGKVGPQTLAALGFAPATSMVPGGAGATPQQGSGGILNAVNSLVDNTIDFFIPGLRDAVSKAWIRFNTPNENYLDFMYTDDIGLVTTGMGDLIDNDKGVKWHDGSEPKVAHQGVNPPSDILSWPWKHRGSNAPASPSEIATAWQTVKQAWPGVSSTGSQSLTDIYLDHDFINKLIANKLSTNQAILAQMFPSMSSWPADAQMALHSMSWAMGTGNPSQPSAGGVASFQALKSALNQAPPDFVTAAAQSHMQGAGIDARNAANKQMFLNAADVLAKNANPNNLYFPGMVTLEAAAVAVASGIGTVLLVLGVGGVGWAFYDHYQKTGKWF